MGSLSDNPYSMTGNPSPAEQEQIDHEVWLAEQDRNGDMVDEYRERRKEARCDREDAA